MNEYSVDRFHKNGPTIFRVMRNIDKAGKAVPVAYLSGPYAPTLLIDFVGQIVRAVRVRSTNVLVTSQFNSFHERRIINADTGFFSLFSFPLLRGNPATALSDSAGGLY